MSDSPSKLRGRHPGIDWQAIVVAVMLVAMLFPLPQPNVQSNQPWRMELLTTLLLLTAITFSYLRDRSVLSKIFAIGSGPLSWIVIILTAFTAWGLISSVWAMSPYSAWHHTAIWANYLLAFLYCRYLLINGRGAAFITSTFFWTALILGSLCLLEYLTSPEFTAVEGNIRLRFSKYAELLITALPVLWVISIYARRKAVRAAVTLASVIGWLGVMLSLSRGAFIAGVFGFALTFGAIILIGPPAFRKRTVLIAAIWAVMTISVQFGFSFLSPLPSTTDYISGAAGQGRESSLARVFIWKVGGQMARDHMFMGVGADNFGIAFNHSRASYRLNRPDDPPDERVADKTIERSHNEYLQILAELGIIGLLIFGAAIIVLGIWVVSAYRTRSVPFSPLLLGSLSGMAAFLVSSGISSFSFRLAQNGMVFFAVFAIAAVELAKSGSNRKVPVRPTGSMRPVLIFGIVSAYLLFAASTFALKGLAEYYVLAANRETDTGKAISLYRKAYRSDPDYSATYLFSSARRYADKDMAAAAADIRFAVDRGFGVVLTYCVLADSYQRANDPVSAEGALTEALSIFPRSPLLRVKYAIFLADGGRINESTVQFAVARNIDSKQANGWEYLLKKGSVAAFLAARNDQSIALPAELIPDAAARHYVDELPESAK